MLQLACRSKEEEQGLAPDGSPIALRCWTAPFLIGRPFSFSHLGVAEHEERALHFCSCTELFALGALTALASSSSSCPTPARRRRIAHMLLRGKEAQLC